MTKITGLSFMEEILLKFRESRDDITYKVVFELDPESCIELVQVAEPP